MAEPTTVADRRPGTVKLVEDLLRKPRQPIRQQFLRNALAGRYHAKLSALEMTSTLLAGELTYYGYRDLARRAERGDYHDDQDLDLPALRQLVGEDPALLAFLGQVERADNLAERAAVLEAHAPRD